MKRLTTILIAVLTATVLFAPACKKDKSKKELLTQKAWKLINYEYNGVSQIALFDACELDNLFYFKTDNSLVTNEGATKCNTTDPQEENNGTWALTNNDTQILFNTGSSSTANINQLDEGTMILTLGSVRSTYTH